MTVDSPQATFGLLRNTNVKMFGHFHNYANSPTQAMRDHSLQPDLSYLQTSPPSLYEPEFITCSSPQMALQSPCDTGQCDVTSPTLSDNGELQPQFEQSLVKGEWESMKLYDGLDQEDSLWPNLASAPTAPPPLVPLCSVRPRIETMMKVNRKDALNGPTLAQLNCDTSVMFDDIENIIKQDLLFSKTAWKQTQNTTPCISSPVFSVASSLSPASFTSTVVSTASSGQSASVLTTPVNGILSLLPGNTTIMPQPTMTTPARPTALSSVSPSKSSPPVESFLVTSTPFTSRFSESQVAPVSTSTRGRKRSMEEECDECSSSVDRKWEEIKEFLHSPTATKDDRMFAYDERTLKDVKKEPGTCSALEPARDIRLSLDSVKFEPAKEIKMEPQDIAYTPNEDLMSEDEGFEDSENSDDEDNLRIADQSDSDDEGQSLSIEDFIVGSKKHKRYFWQYNTQSKGPKGKRLCHSFITEDPHKLDDFEDPVFDPELNQNQYKHHGRARKGDGNDIRPSPLKLYQIGNELKKLNKFMNDLTPVSEMPSTTRQNTRKVKNKFASRACRLKKKAQHEANKLKLYGLEEEHHQLITLLQLVKDELCWCIRDPNRKARESMLATYETLVQKHLTVMVGGHTADYVNGVLEQLAHGNSSGGIKMEDME